MGSDSLFCLLQILSVHFVGSAWPHTLQLSCTHTLQLNDSSFTGTFLLVVVWLSIIGADFLRKHRLLVDITGCHLLIPSLTALIFCSASSFPSTKISLVSPNCPFQALLLQYLRIVTSSSIPLAPAPGILYSTFLASLPGCTIF